MRFRLIVGLGNPGAAYEKTRHNIGFRVIDCFARAKGAEEWRKNRKLKGEIAQFERDDAEKLYLLKPTTFMNESAFQKVSATKIPPEKSLLSTTKSTGMLEKQRSARGGSLTTD